MDKDELKKLSPEKRIAKLRELEEKRKKELEETEDLIKVTAKEIQRNRTIPDIEVPEIQQVDISAMFEAEEGLEGKVPSESKEEPVKYSSDQEYVPRDLQEENRIELQVKIEDTVKYESASERGDKLTASRSLLKNSQKYMKG